MAITSLPSDAKPKKKSWRNKRATVRYRCAPATTSKIYFGGDTEYQRAWLIDLSQGGIGILMSRSLECGTFLTVHVKSADSRKVFEFAAHVVHSTMQSGGDWLVGCEFVTPLSREQLDDLL